MSLSRTALRAGVAALAVVGFAGIAAAQTLQTHVMTVRLPGGGVEQIRYVGNTPPRIYINDGPAVVAAMPSLFGPDSPFAEMERISAAMDREADRMFREAAAVAASPVALTPAALGSLPAGAHEYSFVSTMTGNGVCSRSVEITSQGNGAPPRVVTHTSGDCGPGGPGVQMPTQALPPSPAPSNRPRMIMTKAIGTHPSAPRVQEASAN